MIRPGKEKIHFKCKNCGDIHSKQMGRCPKCQAWNTDEAIIIPPKQYKRLQSKTPIKRTYPRPNNKMSLFSIFTEDLSRCYITHSTGNGIYGIHIHHIFWGPNKKNSEKYGFIVPLRYDWHNMSKYGIHNNRHLDLKFKLKCQEYWLLNCGSKQEFISLFGKWWES